MLENKCSFLGRNGPKPNPILVTEHEHASLKVTGTSAALQPIFIRTGIKSVVRWAFERVNRLPLHNCLTIHRTTNDAAPEGADGQFLTMVAAHHHRLQRLKRHLGYYCGWKGASLNRSRELGATVQSAKSKNLPKREDWILMLLFAGGRRQRYNESVAGRIRLMKELFLFHMRFQDVKDFYTFRPYKYGPYSDEAWHDLSGLIEQGLVQSSSGFGSETYGLTPMGVGRARAAYDSLETRLRRGLVDTKIQYNMMPLHDLIAMVYERFPAFAKESEYNGPPVE